MFLDREKMLNLVEEEQYQITAQWEGVNCHLYLKNKSDKSAHFHKITVFQMDMPFPDDTPVYGEGYSMLSQYSGTIREMGWVGGYGDCKHYKLSAPEGFWQVYNMVRFSPRQGESLVMGFTSCRRFQGEFWFNEKEIRIVLNLEGIEVQPEEILELEDFFAEMGKKSEAEEHFTEAIGKNHPRLVAEEIPTGWCSWLVYGPEVTAQNIYDNLNAIKKKRLALKYIQIDDGYQHYMGDWLDAAEAFGGGIEKLCREICEQGFEPALWVAPFIAEEKSEVFQKHPEWFVRDSDGTPLPSDRVSFGGWRCGPWYMLDGTHPAARAHLTRIFRIMREKWGIKYFKLDANMWGALPFGEHFEQNKTCIEAYRAGMEAILEGAGRDSFLLGCNAPMWPSLGLVHGMRVTGDNARRFAVFSEIAEECFFRNWQHNRFWVNDPDTVLLRNRDKVVVGPGGKPVVMNSSLTWDEFLFNAAYTLASGGMVLSGDDIAELTDTQIQVLRKLLPPVGNAAVFETEDHSVCRLQKDGREILCLFNAQEQKRKFCVFLEKTAEIIDFWTDESLGVQSAGTWETELAGHSARALWIVEQ